MKSMVAWGGGACLLATLASAATFGSLVERPSTGEDKPANHRQMASSADLLPASLSDSEFVDDQADLVPARPFHFTGSDSQKKRAAECLAAAAWYEAGDDPVGQRAVIQTVVNRVSHSAFPNSFCGVIFEGSHLATGCQFTFTCDGSLQHRQPSRSARERALALSRKAISGSVDPSIGNATHYHADYVTPWWSGRLERLTKVGSHIFYRWHGASGTLSHRVRLEPESDLAQLVQQSISKSGAAELAALEAPGVTPLSAAAANSIGNSDSKSKGPQDSTLVVKVGDLRVSGSWALSALKQCGAKATCQIVGYPTQAAVDQNSRRAPSARERPIFVFVRDSASGMDLALWDCEQVARPSQRQCLPARRDALEKLLRDRSGV